MNPLLHSEIFILTLVTGVYLAALWLYRKTRLSLLHPLLVSIPVLALGHPVSRASLSLHSRPEAASSIFSWARQSWHWAICYTNRENT